MGLRLENVKSFIFNALAYGNARQGGSSIAPRPWHEDCSSRETWAESLRRVAEANSATVSGALKPDYYI
jgi:hypothetical protein